MIVLDTVHEYILDDLRQVKWSLRAAGIKVTDPETTHDAISCTAWIRGYEHRFDFVRDVVRSEIRIRMGQYIGKVINKHPKL